MSYPTGRSDYNPRRVRVGAPNPQRDPDKFSVEDLKAEIRYLETLDRKFGANALRALARNKLRREIAKR
jgi:hypothetical protein